MLLAIYFVTPCNSLSVEAIQAIVLNSNHQVVSHVPDCAFYLAFGLSAIWSAQDWFEPIKSGKILKLTIKCKFFLLHQAFNYHLFHVVIQYFLGIAVKVAKSINITTN